jgi:hypothetical protein
MNRRNWLSLIFTASASTVFLPRALRAMTPSGHGMGPGLFFDPADLERIRHNYHHHPDLAEFRQSHVDFDYAGRAAWMDTIRYNDQLVAMRPLHDLAEDLAFIVLMTGEPQAEHLAKRALREIMKFDRWDFFLDGDDPIAVQWASHATVAVALAIDLLGDRLSPDERRQWTKTMWERGTTPCFRTVEDIRHPQTVQGWRFDPESTFFEHNPGNRTDKNRRPELCFNTNLRAVPASALMIGTLAYEMEFGANETTRRYREMGVWGMNAFRDFFQKDGSYEEEVDYANYTATHLVQAIIAMRRHGDTDLTDLIDWDAFTAFLYRMTMRTEADPFGVINWGDSGLTPDTVHTAKRTGLVTWIAGETGNALAQGFARKHGGQRDLWSALWFNERVPAELPPNRNELWVSDLDRVVARTGYDAEHLVVALRSGPPANHEHADRNSLIVKCYGQELITDPLRPAYSYSDPAWRMRLTEGHSAILVDGRGHEHHNGVEGTNASRSFARVVSHESNDTFARVVSDASQPYRLVDTDIKLVRRSVGVLYHLPAVIVVDRVTKWQGASAMQARFFGYNWDGALGLSADETGFLIRRPGAVLQAQVFSNTSLNCGTGEMDILGERAKIHPFVDIKSEPTTDFTLITVMTLAVNQSDLPRVTGGPEGEDFAFNVGGQRVRVRGEAIHFG